MIAILSRSFREWRVIDTETNRTFVVQHDGYLFNDVYAVCKHDIFFVAGCRIVLRVNTTTGDKQVVGEFPKLWLDGISVSESYGIVCPTKNQAIVDLDHNGAIRYFRFARKLVSSRINLYGNTLMYQSGVFLFVENLDTNTQTRHALRHDNVQFEGKFVYVLGTGRVTILDSETGVVNATVMLATGQQVMKIVHCNLVMYSVTSNELHKTSLELANPRRTYKSSWRMLDLPPDEIIQDFKVQPDGRVVVLTQTHLHVVTGNVSTHIVLPRFDDSKAVLCSTRPSVYVRDANDTVREFSAAEIKVIS